MKLQYSGNTAVHKKTVTILVVGVLLLLSALPAAMATGAQSAPSVTHVQGAQTMNMTEYYEKYKPFGLIYDESTDTLTYNGATVRYFEDFYPVSDEGYAGMDHFTQTGTVDVYALRDLDNITRKADGSYDPAGTLLGLAMRSEEEFLSRDICSLTHPRCATAEAASMETGVGSNPIVAAASEYAADLEGGGVPAEGTGYGYDAAATSIEGGDPAEWAALFEKYTPFGMIYDAETGDLYYEGKLVRYFEDSLKIGPNTYDHYLQSSNAEGVIDAHTVFDDAGNIIGIQLYTQEAFDQHTASMFDH